MFNATVANVARQLGSKINTHAKSIDLLHKLLYLNYADSSQNPIASYGADNLAILKDTSRKYGPYGVFQKHVPGGFKLR